MALTDLRETGFPSNFSKLQLADLLAERYPDYDWDKVYLLRGRFAQQKRLERAAHELFPVNIQRVLCCIVLYCGVVWSCVVLCGVVLCVVVMWSNLLHLKGKRNYRERKTRRRSN